MGAGGLGILFVGQWGTLGVRARRRGSSEIAGSRCAAGDAGEEERKGERGRRHVGSADQREGGRESASATLAVRRGAPTSGPHAPGRGKRGAG
jgi:hypothetical protein